MKNRYTLVALAAIIVSLHPGAGALAQSIFGVPFEGGRSHPYDVLHTAIDVRFDEARREVIGSVTHTVRAIVDTLGAVGFDADTAMRIGRVTAWGRECGWRLADDSLVVALPRPLAYGDSVDIAIDYRVVPTGGLRFVAPDSVDPSKRGQVWTQGEAEEHHHWVPLYDYPNDRATTEMRITVRDDWKALSNGDLVSHRRNGDGTATWHYRLDRAHSSYLMMLAAGDYLVTRDTVEGIPLSYWSYPDMADRVARTFGRTPDVMRYMARTIGVPYPWKSYAQVVVAEFPYGGMENTTATTLTDAVLVDAQAGVDYSPDRVIAHEVAHQWFGDLVTTRDWGDLWLQESFATYLAARYLGHRYGEEEFLNEMWENGARALTLDSLSGRDPIARGRGLIANLYQRGSRVLHMLAGLVGERAFWRASRLYLARHGDGHAETADLKNAFEDATGVELDWFFDQWILGAGAPFLDVAQTDEGDTIRLVVRQTQTRDSLTGVFRLRIPIAVRNGRAVRRDTVWIDDIADTLAVAVPRGDGPVHVIFDEGQSTLKRIRFERSREALVAQLAAPHMLDRWEAAVAIGETDSLGRRETWRVDALADAYRREPAAAVRDAIVGVASRLDAPAVELLIVDALDDSAAYVRRAAVDAGHRIADRAERARLLRARLGDSSVSVIASAIDMLALTDTTGIEAILRKWKGVEGRSERMAQAWVGAVASARIEALVDDVADYTVVPFNRTTRWQAFIALSGLERTTPKVRAAIVRGIDDSSSQVRDAAVEAAHAHLDDELRAALTALRARLTPERQAVIDGILEAR